MVINERLRFERILCPLDLSPDSDEALRYAIALAQAFGAQLLVCHCIGSTASARDREEVGRQLDASVRRYLRLPVRTALSCQAILVEGDPAMAITREAARRHVDLIVMRSRRRPYAAALLGSTAESICRTAPCPVLVTHPSEVEWAGKSTNEIGLERIAVAYDFSGDSELALSYGLSLAQEYQCELHVIHVLPPRLRTETPEISLLPLHADDAFRKTAERIRSIAPPSAWCEVKHAVREGHVYREVLAYADEQKIDVICMGASGTGFGMRALFGSNADRVLRQASCPVLIARPLRPAVITERAASCARTDTKATFLAK